MPFLVQEFRFSPSINKPTIWFVVFVLMSFLLLDCDFLWRNRVWWRKNLFFFLSLNTLAWLWDRVSYLAFRSSHDDKQSFNFIVIVGSYFWGWIYLGFWKHRTLKLYTLSQNIFVGYLGGWTDSSVFGAGLLMYIWYVIEPVFLLIKI